LIDQTYLNYCQTLSDCIIPNTFQADEIIRKIEKTYDEVIITNTEEFKIIEDDVINLDHIETNYETPENKSFLNEYKYILLSIMLAISLAGITSLIIRKNR
jgi:hypothetical protein